MHISLGFLMLSYMFPLRGATIATAIDVIWGGRTGPQSRGNIPTSAVAQLCSFIFSLLAFLKCDCLVAALFRIYVLK